MELSIQSVLLNVTNLNQSTALYQDVFDFRLTSQRDEVAALMVYETKRRQVILLRELGRNWHGAGRRSVGLRCSIRGRYTERAWGHRTDAGRAPGSRLARADRGL